MKSYALIVLEKEKERLDILIQSNKKPSLDLYSKIIDINEAIRKLNERS